MAEDRVTIDSDTLFDNIGDRQLEFSGEASGDWSDFAVQYDVLESLSGRIPDGDAVALFQQHWDVIERAAGKALARAGVIGRVIVSGSDLPQVLPPDPRPVG